MEELDPTVKKPNFIQRHKKLVAILTILTILGFAGNYYLNKGTAKKPASTTSIIDSLLAEQNAGETTGPVAKVNGKEISRTDYENSVKEIATATQRQGFTITDSTVASQIRQQAVAVLINTELLVQGASDAGITASDTDVEAEYQNILAEMGDEEVLRLTLQDMNLTEAELREDIREQLAVDAYIQQETNFNDIEVTDDEVLTYYAKISSTNPDVPTFETVQVEIKNQLLAQKRQQVVSDFIQNLRGQAEIEILI